MALSKGTEPFRTAFEDGMGVVFTGTPNEIITSMKHIEWGDTTPHAQDYKSRVKRRASLFGIEMEFYDAYSFLCEMERHGLGRIRPDFVENETTDSTKSNESDTLNPY